MTSEEWHDECLDLAGALRCGTIRTANATHLKQDTTQQGNISLVVPRRPTETDRDPWRYRPVAWPQQRNKIQKNELYFGLRSDKKCVRKQEKALRHVVVTDFL
jgi:hypothetical protein